MSVILSRTVTSPIGNISLLATEEGIVALGLPHVEPAHLEDLASRRLQLPVSESFSEFEDAAQQLAEYFAGTRQAFTLPIDWRMAQGFTGLVGQEVARIPYGQTLSYGEVAEKVGRPGGAQAVGQACGRNPIPLLLPCHRVLAAGHRLGGYSGSKPIKEYLLQLEGIEYT